MRYLEIGHNKKSIWLIFMFCLIFVVLRFPSLFEPNWYGDEGIYQSIGFGLRSGRDFYTGVWDNKPPLLFVIYAIANGDQFIARFISLVFGIGAVILFYKLSKKILIGSLPQLISSLFFVIFFGLPMIEGNIANSENYMLFPILFAVNILFPVLKSIDKASASNKKRLFLGGLILSLSFLIKIVSLFDLAALITFSIFMFFYTREFSLKSISYYIKNYLRIIIWLISGFVFPVLITFIYFYLNGDLSLYLDAAFGRNVDYVGYANFLVIPQGKLYLRLIVLIFFLIIFFIKRKIFSRSHLFIFIWLAFSFFNAYFSNRGFTHYLLLVLPSISLYVGMVFTKKVFINKLIALIIFILLIMNLKSNFSYWGIGKTFTYYNNYINLISNRIDYKTYQDFFDSRNYNDYLLVEYIKKHTEPREIILLWGNSAQVYPLSQTLPPGRYSAAYHITASKESLIETEEAININNPKYIIITRDLNYYPFDLSQYSYKLTIKDMHIYEKIVK